MKAHHNNPNPPPTPRSGRAMAARLLPLLSWNASAAHIGGNWTGKSVTPADPEKTWQPASSASTQSHMKQQRGPRTRRRFLHWAARSLLLDGFAFWATIFYLQNMAILAPIWLANRKYARRRSRLCCKSTIAAVQRVSAPL